MFGEGVLRVLTIAVVAVLIPFVEETFFRGFLFAGLAARFGVLTGLIVSAAVFAVAHADVRVFIPIFVAGLLFGWAYHKTKTLWVPIAAHACQNLAAVMLLDVM
jgi:membrane protease YdiL (CAAX protease family)